MAADDRCPTGIEGLDELVEGGFPRARAILLSGTCGTGKTTLAIQFLYNGITKYNETCILLTLEQSADELKQDMLKFGMDLQELEDDGKLVIIDTSLSKMGLKDFVIDVPLTAEKSFSLLPGEFDLEKITNITIEVAQKIKATRVVIDSLPALDIVVEGEFDVRKMFVKLGYELKNHGLTALLVTEALEDNKISRHEVEEYITDGVIVLRANEALDTRTLRIRKMRLTKHSLKPRAMEFTSNGLKISESVKKRIV